MTVWPFAVFTIVFGALVCAHFVLAYRAWWISRQEQAADIDPGYVRLEDYFARSFRSKLSRWLSLPVQAAGPDGSRLIHKGREKIRVSPSIEFQPQSRSDDILVVNGTFECRAGCTFGREIYVRDNASIGTGTRLQAIAVDGDATLGPAVRVARWVDCGGDLEIGGNSIVAACATAGRTLKLREGAQVRSAYAPTVCTVGKRRETDARVFEEPSPTLEFPPIAGGGTTAPQPAFGVDPKRIKPLGEDCYLYDGDFRPAAGLRTRTKLIVKGDCTIPSGSILEGDLKARGSIEVGAGSICKGNVISEGDVRFGAFSRFYGVVHAGKTLRLGPGVRGGEEGVRVAAFSADTLFVNDDVVVHGKLASGICVVAASGAGDRSSSK